MTDHRFKNEITKLLHPYQDLLKKGEEMPLDQIMLAMSYLDDRMNPTKYDEKDDHFFRGTGNLFIKSVYELYSLYYDLFNHLEAASEFDIMASDMEDQITFSDPDDTVRSIIPGYDLTQDYIKEHYQLLCDFGSYDIFDISFPKLKKMDICGIIYHGAGPYSMTLSMDAFKITILDIRQQQLGELNKAVMIVRRIMAKANAMVSIADKLQ